MADKIEDFGKKIGGARKDLQSILKTRGIEVNDTVEWTDEEREKYIQKKQIWKEPDFEQLVKDGLPVTVAYYIKHLRDSLPAKPARSKQEYQEGYIRMIADIRDHAMALSTEEECASFFRLHVLDIYCTQSGFSSYRPTKDAYGCMTTKFLRAATMSTRMLQAEVKKKHFLFSDDDLIDEAYRIIRYDGQNIRLLEDRAVEYKYPRPSAYNPDYMATSYFYRASSYEDTVPLFESMDNWQAGTYFVIVRNSGSSLIAGNLESEEAARAFAKQDFEKRREDSKSTRTPRKGKFTPQPLEHIERNGIDYRDGKDISGQDMLDSFGFLGGEFGNWENQNDRQYNLNFAYDAFRDLAIALGVDPKDISLGGDLSIAFGSRGRGNALAHFEPDRNVINLTKMKGAGSLAHEWGHAFDRFLAKALQLPHTYATSGGFYRKPDADAGMSRLVEAMNWNEDGSQTHYRLASKEMDRKYSRDSMGYWSSDIEMFARAFAVYVQDKLAEIGIQSDYLTGHAESSIYPEGEERKRLNKLFDSVISELKTRGILHAAQNAAAAAAPVQKVATSSNSDTEEQTAMQQNSELLNLYQAMTLQKGDVIRLHPMKMLDRNMNPAIVSGTTVIIREITDNTVDYQSFDLVTLQPTYHSVAFMTLNELAKEGFEKIGTAAELIAERQAEEAAANAAEQTEQQQEVTPDDETTAEDEKVATSSNTEPEVTEKEPEMNPYDTEEGEKMSELPTRYVTPIGAYSDLGARKLRELSDDPDGYRELLRMTGRIFKIATTVALEFYAQNPEKHYDFISTEAGWLKTGYHLKAGATGITFVDRKGVMQTVYDFNEIVESNEPNIWKVTEENMPVIKAALQIPEETSLINGLMAQYNPDHIVRCLEKLGIPLAQITGEADTENDQIAEEPDSIQAAETQTDNETKDEGMHLTDKQLVAFANSYTNSVHQIIAGRLEIGTDPYNIPVDTEALKLMGTDEQRFIVLSYISGTAKELLRKVDAVAYDLHMSEYSERSERNDLRRLEQAEQRAAEQSLGERAAGNSVESVAERTDLQQGSPSERSDGLASDAADESRDNPAVASGNQSAGSDSERRDNNDLPQAESADSSVYTADQRNGADTDRGTGREVRTDVDAVDGGELSGESRMDDASQPVFDGSTVSGTENEEVSRTAGSAIPQDESASDGRLQSDSGVGTGEAVRDRESGDQGRSVSGGYNAVIASAFSSNAVSTHELTFEQQVDAIAAGTSMTGDIQVCATSDILQQVGCRNLPMMYTKLHMADALRGKSESNPHYHGLTAEQMKQLPEQIAAPAMIFDSISNRVNGNSSIIVILGSTDNDSAPLLMSIKPNGRGRLNGDMVDANFITSIYGKEHDFADYIERIVANNSVLYCDQAKMQSLFAQIGQTVPQSLAALADQTVLHQSRNIANGFGQTFTVHDDINGYQPISTELRAQLMQEFQTKHGLPGSVFVRRDRSYDDGQNTRAYDLRILNGKRFSFRQRIFMVASGEYFSEQKLRDGLAAMEQNPAFKHYLERLANAQRIQERNIRVGDKFRLNMQEVEVTSLEGGLYPDDVVVRSSSQTSTGVNYSVTKNMSKTDLLKGEYLGNPAKDQPELTNEELAAKEMLGNLKDFSLLMSVVDKNNYSDALFDSVIAGRYADMDNPPVTAAFLSVAERFRTNELNYAELAKSLQADGSFVMTGDGIAVSFDRLIEDDGIRFSCRNINQLATWEDLGRLQLAALYELYISNHEEAARDNPDTAAEHAEKIAAATAVMQSYGLIPADASATAEEEANAASSTDVQDTETAADEPATVLFESLSDGTIVARDMEDADPDTNEFPVFAVISVNGTVEFTSPFYSDEQEDAVRARAAEQKAAFTEAWNALSEDEQYNRITTAANEAQFRQIFREESLIADKIAKYAPSIIFGDAEFPLSPDSVIAKWADADRLYFDYDTGTFAWCFYSQDTENFVINRFGLDVLKEAMQYDKPTEIIQERSAQQQTGKTHDSFVETVQSFLNQRADFSIPSRSHGALREIADYLNGYYQQTISQIEIPEYGLSVDLAQIDGIDLITNQLTYEGGIDSDGHERKDNYSEQTLTTHFYMQDGFIWVQEPDFSPSPESNAEMVKTITAFLDRSRTDNDMIVMIRYGGETGNVVYDASAHFVDENETPVEEVATSSNFEQPEAEPEAEQIVKTKDEYLREDLMHGSGFFGGKFRIQEYYLSNTPDNKTFAQFLKGEYGEGGHSGPDMPDVSYGSKGIRIRTEDRTGDYQFTWAQAAREISSMIDSRQYITAENIRDRIADAEYDIRRISLNNPANAAFGDDRVLQRAYEVMRIYGTRFNRLEEDERKFWCEHDWHRPDHSPWGTVEHCTEWGHGIFVVDTDRHGGMMIPERLAEQILTPEAIRIAGEAENGYYCFEEDADMWIPALELFDKGVIEEQGDWRPGFYRSMEESARLYHVDYAEAREAAQNAVIEHALHPDEIRDIYVMLDYVVEVYYFKTSGMTLSDFKDEFAKHEKPLDAMQKLGQSITLADAAYAEQNQSIYAVTINAYQGTITINDMVNGEAVSSSEEPLPESMHPAQPVEETETAAAEEPVPTMTVAEKLQADFDSYVNSLKETGDFMAAVNASAEIAAKQNILKYLETPPEVSEAQRIALVQQNDLLDTVYRRMEEGTAFASSAIAAEVLQKLAAELAPEQQNTDIYVPEMQWYLQHFSESVDSFMNENSIPGYHARFHKDGISDANSVALELMTPRSDGQISAYIWLHDTLKDVLDQYPETPRPAFANEAASLLRRLEKVYDRNDHIQKFAERLGFDANALHEYFEHDNPANQMNQWGYFDKLMESYNFQTAKQFFDKTYSKDIPVREIFARTDNLTRAFITESFDIDTYRPDDLPQQIVPLYRESFKYADEHDELDQYRASRRENSECASAITEIGYDHYNDNILDSETIYAELCEKYDPDRIALIMANAVIQADWDARYYTDVRRWASETMTRLDMQSPTDDTPRPNLHPGLMNILAQRIIEVEQNIQTQKQEPEEPPVEKVSDIPQEVIDNVLRSGGSHPHSDERIIVGMTAIQDQAGKAAFLRDEFGNSARGIFDGETRYAAVFSEDGIIISQGMRALGNHELHLTWEEAASRTDDLIAVGHFAAAEAVTNASDYMRRTLAEDIVSYYRDFARNYFIESRYFAATEKRSVDLLELYLKDTDFCKAALDRLHADDRSEQAEIFLIRIETAMVLSADSENTPYDASVQFVTDPDFDTAIRQFISDDDKMLLMTEIAERGDLDAFYAESHTMQEKEAFLKRHFVLSTEASDGKIVEYGGLGIGISKIDKNHVQLAKATVSWKEVAELLEVPMAMRTAQHDSLTVTGSAVEHRNAQIISNLKEGDRFGFGDKTYKITKINGDFMCSMDRINNDGTRFEGTGEAGHQLIGNWKESLLQLAGQDPIIVDEPVAQTFRIYQMKSGDRFHYQRFESYESLQQQNFPVDYKNYDRVYAGTTPPNTTLDDIYREFNLDRPADFMGHSLSVGDIIVLENGGTLSGTHENAFFVDSVGFMPVPEFVTSREVLRTALQSIEEFSNNEYGTPADTSDLEHIDLAYTTTENGLHEVQIYANIMDCTIVHTIDGEVDDTEQYTDLNDMNRRALRVMTYDTLISDTLSAAEDDIPDDENTPEEIDTVLNIPDTDISVDIAAVGKLTLTDVYSYDEGGMDSNGRLRRDNSSRQTDSYTYTYLGNGIVEEAYYTSRYSPTGKVQYDLKDNDYRQRLLEGMARFVREAEDLTVTTGNPEPQRSYDPKTMRKQIKALDSTEDFYEKVRDIIGYYDGVTLSDHVIKSLQAVADERYEQLTAQEKQQTDLDTLKVGDHVRYDGKEWAVEKIDGDFSISLQNLDATDNMQKLGSTHWKTKLEGLEKIDGFGIPNHSAPKPVKEHGRVQTEGQLNLFDFNNTTAQEQEAETAENSADTAAEQTEAVSPEPIEEVAASSNSGDTAEPDAETSAEEATETAQTEPANEEPQEAAPQQPVGTRIQKQLYQAFAEKFPEMLSGEHTYERYGSLNDLEDDGNGVEPLSIESLGDNQFGMMMYYEQNGDLMRDPDYVFEVDPETKTIQALEYQQDGVPSVGTLYQTVLRNDGTTDMHLQAAIEKSLLQTIRHIDDFDRPLTRYIDSEGEEHDLIDEDTTEAIEEAPASTDKSAYLREVLNEFSEKHGFGELNLVAGRDNVYDFEETFADGETMTLGWLHGEYYSPFTPETLRNSLAELEISCQRRNEDITDLRGRKYNVQLHGGISPLPEVPDNLPEIHYAEEPGMKIRANLSAIREIQRLERCEEAGTSLYEKRVKDYNSKENSDRRLREYCGWGGLSQIFDESFGNLASYRAELQKLLSPEEYTAARASTLTAHYTPQVVIDAMYKAIKQMDMPRDSRILEPSCGTGNFITRMPHSIGNAGIVGVELDSITAKIAKYLATGRDNVTIKNCGFENSGLEDNSFDLVIGNVPFGDYKLIDPDHAKDWLIHDAFFRKALDKVAPGGVVAFITSTGTLDKKNPRVREYLATQANLIGAIRLPNNTFSAAGTNASSDIIFLQKREHPLNALDPKPDWCYTSPVTVEKVGKVKEGEQPEKVQAFINNYFVRNPQMVLGTIKQTTHFDMLTVEPIKDADLEKQLDRAVHKLHGKIAAQRNRKQEMLRQNGIEPWGKDYQFQVQDDKVYYRQGDTMREIKDNKKGHISTEAIKMLIPLRDTTRELLERQQSRLTDEALLPLRERMTELYDAYVEKFGNINDQIAKSSFGDDADYAILCALEDKVDDKYVKAAIFTERTVNPYQEITSAASVESALQISLDQRGRIDIPYMATLLNSYYQEQGIDQEAAMQLIAQDLIENELVFSDPEKQTADDPFASYVERADYLSGEVRRKLVMAESMAQINPEYQRNVDALRDVIPVDIPASEISVTMGAPWIEPEDYTEFLRHLSERPRYSSLRMEVHYSDVTGEYTIPNANSKKNDLNTAETTTYGTPDYNMYALALRILNQRRIEVKVQVPDPKDPGKTIARTDPKATKLANEKAKEIKKEFEKWLFADPARKEKYEAKYNQLFNSLVPRKYDGSRLTFNGMRAGFELKPHQLNCVARTVYGGNTLAAHVVGAGKSAVIAASVMKKKELGLIHKAILVVPKPLTEQSAREWRSVFPDAKLLVVSAADLANEQNREIFTAKVATGDYDCVIVSKEQFQKLGMSPEYQVEFLNKERDELLDQLAERKKENSRDYTIKEIEKKVKDLETRIQKIMNPQSKAAAKDTLMNFETLGFDYLVVDEAHNYKNGFVTTKMSNVSGVTTKASGIAQDMQMKCDYFNQQYGDGHILFATGTPVSNSMTELYVMTRYLRSDLLSLTGTARFDDWAATFGNVTQKNKINQAGQMQLKTSFSSFKNMPELMQMYKEFADLVPAERLPDTIKRPDLVTGKPQIIAVEASPEQKEYVQLLAERSLACQKGLVNAHDDNPLTITREARLVGLGNRAIAALYMQKDGELPDGFDITHDSKIDACLEQVKRIYDKTTPESGVQIIFSDIAVNDKKGNFSAYNYMREKLKEMGVPENEIVFAPKANAADREDIFRDINEGKYRIVIASTGTLGTGANIQKKLYALHNLDIPWKPSDFEQRQGRILRQGNSYDAVEIFNYVTKGTMDSFLYQIVTDKARYIAQLWNDECPARIMEDCDETVLTYGHFQAVAQDNPDLLHHLELQNKIDELKLLRTEYRKETTMLQREVAKIPDKIAKTELRIEQTKKDIESVSDLRDKKTGKVSDLSVRTNGGHGEVLRDRAKINEYLQKKIQSKAKAPFEDQPGFTIGKFTVKVQVSHKIAGEFEFAIKGEREPAYYCNAAKGEHTDNYQRLVNFFETGLAKELERSEQQIEDLNTEQKQSQDRIDKPFPSQAELDEAEKELETLDAGLTKDGLLTDGAEYSDGEEDNDHAFTDTNDEEDDTYFADRSM